MLARFSRYNTMVSELSAQEQLRFRKFAYAKIRYTLRLLMFGMPLLFAIGWGRDLLVLGEAAQWTLLLRIGLTFGLLILASLTWLSGFSRGAEAFGALYALLFSLAIAITSAIEPERLSLTHVAIMLMVIILLPFSISRTSAIATCAGLLLPMYGLLWYLDAPTGLWVAYTVFFAAGCMIGLTQRNAQLLASLDIFQHRERLLRRLHQNSHRGASELNGGGHDGWETRAHYLHRHQREAAQHLSVIRLDIDLVEQARDQHGDGTKNDIAKRASDAMRTCLRHGDMLARVDANAFVILLPGSDADTATRVAERIRAAISDLDSQTPVTISIGITQTRERESLRTATERAGAALQEARQRGQNRMVLG